MHSGDEIGTLDPVVHSPPDPKRASLCYFASPEKTFFLYHINTTRKKTQLSTTELYLQILIVCMPKQQNLSINKGSVAVLFFVMINSLIGFLVALEFARRPGWPGLLIFLLLPPKYRDYSMESQYATMPGK